jgi:hypothetical protein
MAQAERSGLLDMIDVEKLVRDMARHAFWTGFAVGMTVALVVLFWLRYFLDME